MYIRRFTIALLMLFIALPVYSSELLDKIAVNMGKVKSIKSQFRQEKHLKNFAFPLKITGVMYVDHAQKRLAWLIREPMQSNCIISGNKLTQWDGDSGRTVTLDGDRNASLKTLFQTMRMLFSGDINGMIKDFTIEKEANPVTLIPEAGTPAGIFIKRITFRFSPDLQRMELITFEEKSGDITRIEFFDTQINVKIGENIWQAAPAQ